MPRDGRMTNACPVGAVLTLLVGLGFWLWPIGHRRPDAGRRRRDPVLDGPDGVLGRASALGAAAALERPLGLWLSRHRREPDGGLLPAALVLYGLLPTEVAYTVEPGAPHALGGTGGLLGGPAVRHFRRGSALAGFAWSTCGFFVIHLAHQWGYTTGCWMPWAWGLAWRCSTGRRAVAATPFLLAVVLTFSLAGALSARVLTRSASGPGLDRADGDWRRGSTSDRRRGDRGVDARRWSAVFPLAAMQLWPTLRLARLAATHARFRVPLRVRGDAVHLVNYRRARALPSLAALAADRLGPVSYLARGAPGLCRARPALPGAGATVRRLRRIRPRCGL